MEWSRDYQNENELKNFEINLWKNEFAHKKDLQISLETQFLTCFKFIHF